MNVNVEGWFMKIFEYMDDIFFKEYSQIIKEVDNKRIKMLKPDESLLYENNIIVDLEKIEEIPNGRFNIEYKGILFECVFHYKPEEVLYVILNGALTQKVPEFSRWSYYKFLSGSMLNISDPMYRIYDDLKLGWYYGNKEYDMREYIVEIVEKIAHILDVQNKNIIFWGSSGGGAATIECASLIKGARAVAINPQIILSEYFYSAEFTKITKNDLEKDSAWHRNNAIYYLKKEKASYYILIFNIRAVLDMKQVGNICRELDITLKYGINVFEHFIIWLYDAECEPYVDGHCAQEYYCIAYVIEFILKNIGSENLEKKYGQFFRMVNEFWYFKWKQEKDIRSRMANPEKLILCRETKKKVAIFGGEVLRISYLKNYLT